MSKMVCLGQPHAKIYIPSNYGQLHVVQVIVSSRVKTPPFMREPPFLGTFLFLKQVKKLPPSFWQPSKLVHVNCIKHFKMNVSYYTSQTRISLSFLFILSGSTLYLLLTLALIFIFIFILDIAFNVLYIWCARGMNMKHF